MTHTATCGHTSDTPAQLCATCTNQLRDRLHRLPCLYTALAAWLPPASNPTEPGHGPAAEAPMPLRQDVLDLRGPGGIVGILEDWRSAIHNARGFTEPTPVGDYPLRAAHAATAIQRNLLWISLTWELGADLATEICRLEARAVAIIEPPDHTIPLGPCPADLGDDQICGAILRAASRVTTIRCHACGHLWPPSTWLSMREWMDYDRARETAA